VRKFRHSVFLAFRDEVEFARRKLFDFFRSSIFSPYAAPFRPRGGRTQSFQTKPEIVSLKIVVPLSDFASLRFSGAVSHYRRVESRENDEENQGVEYNKGKKQREW